MQDRTEKAEERVEHIQRLHAGILEDQDKRYMEVYGRAVAAEERVRQLRRMARTLLDTLIRCADDLDAAGNYSGEGQWFNNPVEQMKQYSDAIDAGRALVSDQKGQT